MVGMAKNPKSQKLPIRDSSNSWSELPVDLLNLVFKRLGLADIRRAESACSSWYSASRRCVTQNQRAWLILLPEEDDDNNNHSCTLFNPEEKGKLYKRRDKGVEFAKSRCLATNGSWLFMVDLWYNLYIVNLFTKERIDLPWVESQLGTTKVEQTLDGWFRIWKNGQQRVRKYKDIIMYMQSPVFWIDEQTKNYIVLWGFGSWCVVYSKKGDKFWNQIPLVSGCSDLVYKDHKLYYLAWNRNLGTSSIKIFDFSGEIPQETFQCGVTATTIEYIPFELQGVSWGIVATKLVVTVTGDVLKVEKLRRPMIGIWSFHVYKVYSSGFFKNYEQVDSLGNEAMLFDLGITVLANDDMKRNYIYFNIIRTEKNSTRICLFNLETQKMEEEPLHKFDCSSPQQLTKARWFLPSFRQT